MKPWWWSPAWRHGSSYRFIHTVCTVNLICLVTIFSSFSFWIFFSWLCNLLLGLMKCETLTWDLCADTDQIQLRLCSVGHSVSYIGLQRWKQKWWNLSPSKGLSGTIWKHAWYKNIKSGASASLGNGCFLTLCSNTAFVFISVITLFLDD